MYHESHSTMLLLYLTQKDESYMIKNQTNNIETRMFVEPYVFLVKDVK